jgi:hypothetical protein
LQITFDRLSAWHHFREVTEKLVSVQNNRGARLLLVLNKESFLAHVRLFEQLEIKKDFFEKVARLQ